jgi:hypothetical protein
MKSKYPPTFNLNEEIYFQDSQISYIVLENFKGRKSRKLLELGCILFYNSENWPASQGLPGYTITIPSKEKNKDLGRQNVQFTDPCLPELNVTTYGISYMNFSRETKN